MNSKQKSCVLILMVFFLCISVVSANDLNDTITNESSTQDEIIIDNSINNIENQLSSQEDKNINLTDSNQDQLQDSENEFIMVNDWDELQYYCSLTDKDYNLKLKENTNYYPTDYTDSSYQIRIKNNVKIVGSNGSYIGDTSSNVREIRFSPFVVVSSDRCAFHLENITFKWINCYYNYKSYPIISMSGKDKYTNVLKNCLFDTAGSTNSGPLVGLGSGKAILDNCSFINCWTSDGGLIRVSDSKMEKTTHMIVKDCYFRGNHAAIAPACIYNSGKLTVINSSFIGNGAGYWAGAIHTAGYGNTSIYGSYFKDNVAGWNGGALYTYAYLQIYNTTFINNHCTTNNGGGAIGACKYISTPHIYVEGCLFKENKNNCWSLDSLSTTGTGRGGAISFMDEGSIEVRDTTFIANAASIGTAICAWAAEGYGSPNVIIVNNSFINHTRAGDTLNVQASGTPVIVSDNYFYGNSIEFSKLTLTKISESNEQATLQADVSLSHPSYYDSDILTKTLYDVYINDKYVKTVDTTTFTIDFGDLDICDVYIIPTISNQKSNPVTVTSTREYIFVSKSYGNDTKNGISRDNPVNTIERALELATVRKNIILLDGDYSENLEVNYDVTIKGEGNATLTNYSSFTINSNNFTLKNLYVNNLISNNFIEGNTNLIISNCVFENNKATLINNAGFTNVTNSILLNNSKIIQNSNYDLDYNWWGNTLENPNKPVDLNINNWLILTAISNVNALENNQKAEVQFGFYLNNNIKYNNLREINLNITPVNGTVNKEIVSSISKVTYTLTAFGDGVLYARYNNVITEVDFKFLKSNPAISVETKDIMFGDALTVKVSTPKDASGNITVKVHNQTQTLEITSQSTVFSFKDLKADNYDVLVNYSGDKKYLSKNTTAKVNVVKYNSTTNINLGHIAVGEDLLITVTVNGDATGNVTLYINNNMKTLFLAKGCANYTIKNIPRGDYVIQAFYNGDDKYLTSKSSTKIEVDNINATMTIKADNITYGQNAVIQVNLNGDARGNVSVTIDGVTNTSSVNNGIAIITLRGLEAGVNKNITVFYTGDDTYFNKTSNSIFTINKADLLFNISSTDIMIGQDAVVKITVPAKTTGTFTIKDKLLNIPMTGEVEYIIPDLEIGEYIITAIYNGNNYNTVEKSTSFKVKEYAQPQWSNNGADTANTGKTSYIGQSNSNILFTLPVNEDIHSITIDSEGNIYITTNNAIYSYDSQGDYRWNFSSDDVEGNFSASVIGRDVIITPKSGDTLYFVNQSNGVKYDSNIYQASSLFTPVINSNANVYVLSEYQRDLNVYSFVIVPYRIWDGSGSPTLVTLDSTKPLVPLTSNDDIIVVLSEGRLRLIDANTLEAKFIKSGNYQPVRPVIGEGNIIYAVLDDSIVAYEISGARLFKTKITGGIGDKLLLDSDKGLYATNANGNLYRYDLLTGKEVLISNLAITSGILIDGNSNLCFGVGDVFYCTDSEGSVLWQCSLGSKITGTPVMNKEGVIYINTIDNKVFSLSGNTLKDPNLTIQVSDIFEGEVAVINVTLDGQVTGSVELIVNNVTYVESISNGGVVRSLSNLPVGVYQVNVTYNGDLKFNKANKIVSFTVKSKTTPIDLDNPNLDVEVLNITEGEDAVINITLDNNATGSVYFIVNNIPYIENIAGGSVVKVIPNLSAGEYQVNVTYSGDSRFNKTNKIVSFTVKSKETPITNLDDPNLKAEFKNNVLIITLNNQTTGNVSVTINGFKYSEVIQNGKVTKSITAPGEYNVVISYPGDLNFNSSDATLSFTIKSQTSVNIPSSSGNDLTITLASDATGTLTVKVNGQTYTKQLVNGKETVTLPDGSYDAVISYSGDAKYAGFTITKKVTVKKPVTVTKKVSKIVAKKKTFKAKTKVKKYTVSLKSGKTPIKKVKLIIKIKNKTFKATTNAKGKATFKIKKLTRKGKYTATIKFAGNKNYKATSKKVKIVVK